MHEEPSPVAPRDAELVIQVHDVEPTEALQRERDAESWNAKALADLDLNRRGDDVAQEAVRDALGDLVGDVRDDGDALLAESRDVAEDLAALIVGDEVAVGGEARFVGCEQFLRPLGFLPVELIFQAPGAQYRLLVEGALVVAVLAGVD